MAGSPKWKLYTADGVYEASAKHVETLAAAMGVMTEGATIRAGHGITCWTEGKDGHSHNSYDVVAETCDKRLSDYQIKAYNKTHGAGAAEKILAARKAAGVPTDERGKE